MTDNFADSQITRKAVIETAGGVVASQHKLASQVGAEVLAAGGNAVDAALAAAFALGVVEPWMSGPAGGGAMTLWEAETGRAHALNYGMRSPAALDPAEYPVTGGVAGDLFPWPRVQDDRNVRGATAVAVPGSIAGFAAAHDRFARMPWAELIAPATGLAREGLIVDWYASLLLASVAPAIAKDRDLAALFLEDGTWVPISGWTDAATRRIDLSGMAATLDRLAHAGARDFYEGDIAAGLVADVRGKGGSLSAEDLAAYRAEFVDPITVSRGDTTFHVQPGLTAGPTFADIFDRYDPAEGHGPPAPQDWRRMAGALSGAYAHRIAAMGHDGEIPMREACTTHLSVVDRDGNMVALTNTLLSLFGSATLSQSTGLPLNNGLMWFDPEPGKPNSLAPGKPCLMNVCPMVARRGDDGFALGASGGRKIVGAVAQVASFLADRGMSLEEAFHQPRIDHATETIVADAALGDNVLAALEQDGRVLARRRTVYPLHWACMSGVRRQAGRNSGCTEIMSPWADAVAEPA